MFTQDQPWKKVCVSCYLDSKTNKRRALDVVPVAHAAIESDMLRRLIQLCHPDRHGNSEASNVAIRHLLALKKEAAHA